MISQAENPVAWAMFVYELADAQEALNDLMKELADGAIDADEFRIDIGHVYAHLNRAWYRRWDEGLFPERLSRAVTRAQVCGARLRDVPVPISEPKHV